MGLKPASQQRRNNTSLNPSLQQALQNCEVYVGVVFDITKFFPSIYKFLWDLSDFCLLSIPIGDINRIHSNLIWQSLLGERIIVSRNINYFLKSQEKMSAIVIISEVQNPSRNRAGKSTAKLNLAIAFPPFPSAAKTTEELIDSCNLGVNVSIPANQEFSSYVLAQIARNHCSGPLHGLRVLVTAGPTQGPIDAVRFVSSTSSGGLGSEIADVLYLSGCEVQVLLGKGSTRTPQFAPFSWIRTPFDLQKAIEKDAAHTHIVIFAAAVLDYIPTDPKTVKTPSGLSKWTIELEKTPKIINLVKKLNNESLLVGFKLLVNVSNQALLEEGKKRLKNVDILVANDLSKVSEHTHEAYIITKNRIQKAISKSQIAQLVKNELENLFLKLTPEKTDS